MNTDDLIFVVCVLILTVFFGLGLGGQLPGQCEGEHAARLVCQQHNKI
jgi:hypothetical protein